MNVFVDIDGVICHTENADYPNARPVWRNIGKINDRYDSGDRITYWTARGTLTGKDWSSLTRNQLQEWGCKYHAVMFGKPDFDIFIDDKAINVHNL